MYSNFKWHYGAPFISLHITLNVRTIINEKKTKGFEKCCIANEGHNTPYTKAPINKTT
jgi:hypothetical protein